MLFGRAHDQCVELFGLLYMNEEIIYDSRSKEYMIKYALLNWEHKIQFTKLIIFLHKDDTLFLLKSRSNP